MSPTQSSAKALVPLDVPSLWPTFLLVISLLRRPRYLWLRRRFNRRQSEHHRGHRSPAANVRVNQTLQLTSSYLASGQPMTFSVNGIPGGNANSAPSRAPAFTPLPRLFPLPTRSRSPVPSPSIQRPFPGSVSIQVWNPIPVLSTVTPNGFSEGTTTVTVNGSQFVYGAQISWNGALVPTTYVSSTELVAQIAAPNPGTFPLTVTNPNPGSASAPAAFVEGGPRPGGAARLSRIPAPTCASSTR